MARRKEAKKKKAARVAERSRPASRTKRGGAPPGLRTAPEPDEQYPFLVVGMGASAGGLEALREFFGHMRPDSGLAFVLVTHQVPGRHSLLPELLAKVTEMRVVEAGDGLQVRPNIVHVAPPGQDLAIEGGVLRLRHPPEARGAPLPIDFFLRSLADDQKHKAVAIIFSGTGTDGTVGLRAIKGELGMSMVQEAGSARFSGMPESAIGTGLVDYVVPPAKMPATLLRYARGLLLRPARAEGGDEAHFQAVVQRVFPLLRARTGHDFAEYKSNTIRRRIERRMNVHHLSSPREYVRYLHENPHEIDLLFKELLIGVTTFFRDPATFELLETQILPKLLADKPQDYNLRAWTAGCSSGEEAYSIAILLRECANRLGKRLQIQVFGTDLDAQAIEAARLGYYPEGIAVDVSRERLDKFFTRENGGFRIKKEIRELVIFAPQNVINDPPFTKLDLITCRNLLIYLNGELQRRLLPLFHYALRPEGVLLLGSSESVGSFTDLFTPLDKKHKVFARLSPGAPPGLPRFPLRTSAAENQPALGGAPERRAKRQPSVAELMERLLMQKFAPPSVLVNERGDIFHIHGRTGLYLEPAQGKPSLNVLHMAREGLRLELAAALRKAASQSSDVVRRDVEVNNNSDSVRVNLAVRPIREPESVRGLLLITFEPAAQPAAPRKGRRGTPRARAQLDSELERELQYTKESLQSTIEEFETANEEMKSTNEELQSTNEELQSANEELETSREEMQSLNEELQTVNAELQTKIDELSQANDDMKNLLNSTDVATIFLDNDLNIKRFTLQAQKVINLIPSDIGRPLGDIVSKLAYDELVSDARQVLQTLVFKEREVQTKEGGWFLMKIMPYRTGANIIDGLVITFVDVTELRRAEQDCRRLSSIVGACEDAIISIDLAGKITAWNAAAERLYGYTAAEAVGQNAALLLSDGSEEAARGLEAIRRGERVSGYESERTRKDGKRIRVYQTISPIRDAADRIVGGFAMVQAVEGGGASQA